MIKKYSEPRLVAYCLTTVAITSAAYMTVGATTWGTKHENGYGYLPSYALALDAENEHTFISLVFFTLAVLTEGVVFAYFLD
jgi:hypothetical protein